MSSDSNTPRDPPGTPPGGNGAAAGLIDRPIDDELKESYLTYAMSVIVSRALPDVRDGLKPSQRRILVAMNDLNLTPGAARVKCAKICGDTSGNYHPHGEMVIYPTLVRMAQDWNMRELLIDKQGNFGSIAGLPPAQMRYTEARLSPAAAMMLDDLRLDTVDYVPTYDDRRTEPTVLPSKFPNLLINGSTGIAVSMATSLPPHNAREVCDALAAVIDNPDISINEILRILPGPDFPTGGVICGRGGIRRGYHTGRGKVVVRARASIEEYKRDAYRIIVSEIPYLQFRDSVVERIAKMVNEARIPGISDMRDESDLNEPVRIVIEVKRNADPEVVLNQLYEFTPLQSSFSLMFLALVDGKPRQLNIKEMLREFVRHRLEVIRRRTQHLLARARRRKHTVEGLLLALANIDEIIRVIRASRTQVEAKAGIMAVSCPAAMLARALGERGFEQFQSERGVAGEYRLTPVQADDILAMRLAQLVNLEQEKLADEHRELLDEIAEHLRILSSERNILEIIKDDLRKIRDKLGDDRRTEISDIEAGEVDVEDLITEENMVVTLSHRGYIKRTAASAYRAQRRGGKGLTGARVDEEDPIAHLFVASTHDYLLVFTNKGKVYWQKVYELPELARDAKGRAIVNLLNLEQGEAIAGCLAVRDFTPNHYLMMATKNGLVKKTPLEDYSRPKKGGIIAIKLQEGDELIDVMVTKAGDEVVLSTAGGMAIRFNEADARPMGRNTTGVKGINLDEADQLVGMVVADPEATLLTVCARGYGKRTRFGPNDVADAGDEDEAAAASSSNRYRTQRRGGKGVRDIKTTERNGPVVAIARVDDGDEVIMMSKGGKIQRIAAADINTIGRNTQGVRIMSLDDADALAAVVRVPKEDEPPQPPAGASQPAPAASARPAAQHDGEIADDAAGDGMPRRENHAAGEDSAEDDSAEDDSSEELEGGAGGDE